MYPRIYCKLVAYPLGSAEHSLGTAGVVGKMSRLRVGRSRVRIPGKAGDFFFPKLFRPTLGSNQPLIHWISEFFPGGENRVGRDAQHALSTMPSLRR